MKLYRFILYVVLTCLLGSAKAVAQQDSPFRLQASRQSSMNVSRTFTGNDTLYIFNSTGTIYGLSVDMQAVRHSADFLVRLVLEDSDGKEHLVAESYREIATGDTISFNGHCEETALLSGIQPRRLKLYVSNATLTLNSIGIGSALPSRLLRGNSIQAMRDTLQLHQVRSKVEQINAYNRSHNKMWIAGVTSVSLRPFEVQRRLIGFPANMSSGGIEYYAGGIFEFGERIENAMQQTRDWYDTICVDNFDWRNRHGQNWMTPVKDQGNTAACTAFAAVGALEALANLYYNQHLNLNLSELDAITNHYHQPDEYPLYEGAIAEDVVEYVATHGVCNDAVFSCENGIVNGYDYSTVIPDTIASASGYGSVPVLSYSDNPIKRYLINKGPLVSGYKPHLGMGHSMVLVGYCKLSADMDSVLVYNEDDEFSFWIPNPNNINNTCWIFKNSYGLETYGNIRHIPYMYIIFNSANLMAQPYYFNTPVNIIEFEEGDTTKVYNSSDIVIEDRDGDGYYNWGIGLQPDVLPEYAQLVHDGDDSNPLIGGMNEYGYCLNLNPDELEIEECIWGENDSHHGYNHIVLENVEEYLYEDVFFHNGARITIKNGGILYVENGCNLYDIEIRMEPGSKLVIREGSTIHLRKGVNFEAPLGAIVEIINGSMVNYSE